MGKFYGAGVYALYYDGPFQPYAPLQDQRLCRRLGDHAMALGKAEAHPSKTLHPTQLDEYFRIKGRQKWYESVDVMQKDMKEYLVVSTTHPHQGRGMNRRTPLQAFMDGMKHKGQIGNKSAQKAA